MTAVLICVTCVLMNCLIGYSGKHYMDTIGNDISTYSDTNSDKTESFDPSSKDLDNALTIIGKRRPELLQSDKLVYYSGCHTAWRGARLFCQWTCTKATEKLCLSD